ncbi:sulfate adenylyltransferase subunit CysD [Flavobacteriaceae bacterium Ap0902]|nr:sulfate adenylyltransferase subunit CysD [Flavobacteriaceae bacterium Ap0902]
MRYKLSHLKELEAEAIYVFREVYAQFDKPAILFSGGKDSTVLIHLAKKAFYPAKIPFPLIHIDTGHNFPETIEFRDQIVDDLDIELIVGSVQKSIDEGRVREETGIYASRNVLQSTTLLDTIEEHGFDAAIGGGRRDEEKSRAKERFFSHRDEFGQWNPRNQRPELWTLFNGRKKQGEHFRIFPISNWTELDIWNYIAAEKIELPSLYFAHHRKVLWRNNSWIPDSKFLTLRNGESLINKKIRFRTLGDITITGGIESDAHTVEEVIQEISAITTTERGHRADDKRGETAMEDRKRDGYF